MPPGRVTDFKSNYLFGVSAWGENHVTSHVSTLFKIAYTQIYVPTNTLCDCNYAGSIWLQDEEHHWGSFGAGIRYNVNPKSTIKIFLDAKLKGDLLMVTSIKSDDIKKTSSETYGYRRFAPSFEFAIGAKWNRFALNFSYQSTFARTFTRDAGEYDQVTHPYKTAILRNQLFGKLSYTAFKIK